MQDVIFKLFQMRIGGSSSGTGPANDPVLKELGDEFLEVVGDAGDSNRPSSADDGAGSVTMLPVTRKPVIPGSDSMGAPPISLSGG